MLITVQTFGMVRSLLRQATFEIDAPPGTTVISAVQQLVEAASPHARRLILSPDERSLKVVAMMDGKTVGPDAVLHDGAELNLMLGQH